MLLGPDGPIARSFEGYEHRQAQLQMASLVEDTLRYRGIALCEAGTGTGKTLAYLVPALLSGLRVVVSTGTKTLQDQIMHHDVPLLTRYLGMTPAIECMKGLSNYVCLRRYKQFLASAQLQSSKLAKHLPLLEDFVARTKTGDRAELTQLPQGVVAELFSEIQSGPETRIGPRCSDYEACFVTRMRKRAAEAQLIVVNHHLLFADLALKGAHGAGVIPEYDAVILDEAHLIEDIASEFFGTSISTGRVEALVRDADRALQRTSAVLSSARVLHDVSASAHQLFAALRPHLGADGTRVPLPAGFMAGAVEDAFYAFDNALLVLISLCRDAAGEAESVAQLVRRSEQMRRDLSVFTGPTEQAHVLWTSHKKHHVMLGRTPVDIGQMLREHVYHRNQATVFTSATLSTSGDFTFIKDRLGIDFEVDELSLPSPFDYDSCAALYLPDGLPDYRDQRFIDAAAEHVLSLVKLTGGGAFVLCTSLRLMHALHKRCEPNLGAPVLMQGQAPNQELLDRFSKLGDGVLFATMSFWQGVDVPGEALRLVIIDKLPFEVPSDPLVQARCERLQAQGRSPFMDYVVPSAALTLKQGFGRLIRTRHDRGIVAVLDPRLTKKGYGKVFLRSLPAARRCHSYQEVASFWFESSAN